MLPRKRIYEANDNQHQWENFMSVIFNFISDYAVICQSKSKEAPYHNKDQEGDDHYQNRLGIHNSE